MKREGVAGYGLAVSGLDDEAMTPDRRLKTASPRFAGPAFSWG